MPAPGWFRYALSLGGPPGYNAEEVAAVQARFATGKTPPSGPTVVAHPIRHLECNEIIGYTTTRWGVGDFIYWTDIVLPDGTQPHDGDEAVLWCPTCKKQAILYSTEVHVVGYTTVVRVPTPTPVPPRQTGIEIGLYWHYKGDYYFVEGSSTNPDTGEQIVHYRDAAGYYKHRSLEEWNSPPTLEGGATLSYPRYQKVYSKHHPAEPRFG